jgi:hypothetical protein
LLPQRPSPHKSIRRYPFDAEVSHRRGGEIPSTNRVASAGEALR